MEADPTDPQDPIRPPLEDDSLLKPTKAKKPRSAAQIESFEKARIKRLENANIKKKVVSEALASLKEPKTKVKVAEPVPEPKIEPKPIKKVVKPRKPKPVVYESDDEESDDEPAPIVQASAPPMRIIFVR